MECILAATTMPMDVIEKAIRNITGISVMTIAGVMCTLIKGAKISMELPERLQPCFRQGLPTATAQREIRPPLPLLENLSPYPIQ